jgi:hypothetical protein
LCDSVIKYLYSDKNGYKRLLSFVNGNVLSLQSCNCFIYTILK